METHREVEVKFRVADFGPLREQLRALGAALLESAHERNFIFDDSTGSLRAAGKLLRLRQDRRHRLTYKAPLAAGVGEAGLKVRREVEVEVSNLENAREILEGLGLRVSAAYEKDRETWRLGDALVCLDELDFGRFVEIEGTAEGIGRAAAELGLDLAKGLTESYLELMALK